MTQRSDRDYLRWIAQTVHQAYHQEATGTWEECSKSICAGVKAHLEQSTPDCCAICGHPRGVHDKDGLCLAKGHYMENPYACPCPDMEQDARPAPEPTEPPPQPATAEMLAAMAGTAPGEAPVVEPTPEEHRLAALERAVAGWRELAERLEWSNHVSHGSGDYTEHCPVCYGDKIPGYNSKVHGHKPHCWVAEAKRALAAVTGEKGSEE